ncbi:probable cation-transporting ATPase 13A5 [Oppia nitens]|uniref:probable cation-transporting ATPase 13A5 n=1 Tax=Oppia nitens TaxID=1686743 RepID=UPI0023DCCD1E|nr:probable cation-transporting ATPase 13A5 [Oppia nitens]
MTRDELICGRINIGEEDELIIEGYMPSHIRTIFFLILIIISCGTLLIVISWKPSLRIRLTHSRCSLDQSNSVILKDIFGEEYVEKVEKMIQGCNSAANCIHFYHKKIKYIWRMEINQFVKLKGLESSKCGVIYSMIEGLNTNEVFLRTQLYGLNSILVEIKPIFKLIIEEISGPFYIYQMFIFTIWMIQLYYQFSVCVLLLSIFSVTLHVWQTRKQSLALKKKVHSESEITVIRDGSSVKRMSKELVPGDVILLSTSSKCFTMECDVVLMSGNCIMDESMLTGESVPISKVSLTDDLSSLYSPMTHKINTLFCGTKVLSVQSSDSHYVKAIVVRTGFFTTKGELVRSILFPKPVNFKLKNDLLKCMTIFFCLGIPCMAYTTYCFLQYGARIGDIAIIVLDVATFLVPPLLPAVMTSINAHSQRRLSSKGVFCLNSNAISSCGGIDVMCFDKTGTLTEDSINLLGVIPVNDKSFTPPVRNISQLDIDSKILLSLGACHSLSEHEGKVDGDGLDLNLFDTIKWEFKSDYYSYNNTAFEKNPERIVGPIVECVDTSPDLLVYGIVKQFPFESLLQRLLVIVKQAFTDHYVVIVKGAPELIASFCNQTSLPEDYSIVLESYTRDGLRVLATASKEIDVNLETALTLSRDELESDLNFDGFLVFQNPLKSNTISVLKTIKNANIRSIMITGDNLLTSISVGRECGLIDECDSVVKVDVELYESPNLNQALRVFYSYIKLPGFSEKINLKTNGGLEETLLPNITQNGRYHMAIEGKVFDLIRQNDLKLLNQIVHKGTIFSRMTPNLKLQVIEILQKQGHQVGMCGDGANDCGALRTANAGISLSVAEASVASPFTYKQKDISCVPMLISEGRATLSATIGAFKYQVCYCFVLLGAVLLLFWEGNKPSDGTYVFVDIILNILPPVVFGTTKSYPIIVKQLPTRTILSFLPQFSMYSFIIFQVIIYLGVKYLTVSQIWYEPFKFEISRTHTSEASQISLAIFSVNMISYIISAIIFSPGPPYRSDIFTNKWYLVVVLINFALVSCVVLYPPNFVLTFLN